MRIILAGSRSFGSAVLDELEDNGHDIAAVWSPSAVAEDGTIGDRLTADVWDRRNREDEPLWWGPNERTPVRVAQLGVHLFVCAHSHDFISKQARAATELGGIGYHPSLLPRHRGRDAVKWTIHMGDPIAGGTVYWLTDNVDGGPIAWQQHCHVLPKDNASTLWRERLFPMGVEALAAVLRDLDEGFIVEKPQDERCATWEPSWERPPLHRPDLLQIGRGVNGYTHVVR